MAIPVGLYPRRYAETVAGDSDVGLAGARLNVAKDDRLNEAFLEYYLRVPGTPKPLAPADRRLGELRRAAYLGSARDEYGKGLRWSITKRLEPLLSPDTLSRNQVLMADAEVTANQSLGTVDVPQEYFIPAAKLGDFLNDLRGILANHPRPDLMDVLIRSVGRDKDAYLKYAREDAFAVMLTFRVVPVADGEEALTNLGRELIDKALELGGTYYLPYRQHATADQFKRAYPMALDFFALKRKYDPGEVFQNHFYSNYGRIEP
jgi:FAD/FMN-containing dehydrogenase